MRSYSNVAPTFWTGETGAKIRALGCEAISVSLYLMTGPSANMTGLYHLPIASVAHAVNLSVKKTEQIMQRLIDAGFVQYDFSASVVWVVNMVRFQVAETLQPGDKRCAGIRNTLLPFKNCAFYEEFHARYGDTYHLAARGIEGTSKGLPRGITEGAYQGASKPLRSQEQEQEHKIQACSQKAGKSPGKTPSIFLKVTEELLRSNDLLRAWIKEAAARRNPIVSESTDQIQWVFSVAEYALAGGGNPVKKFIFSIQKRRNPGGVHDDSARRRLKGIPAQAAPPINGGDKGPKPAGELIAARK